MKESETTQVIETNSAEKSGKEVEVPKMQQQFLVFHMYALHLFALYFVGMVLLKASELFVSLLENREMDWAYHINLSDTPIQFLYVTGMFVVNHAMALLLIRAKYASDMLAISSVLIAFVTTIVAAVLISPYLLFGFVMTFITVMVIRNRPLEEGTTP